jgi:hypothetical protein
MESQRSTKFSGDLVGSKIRIIKHPNHLKTCLYKKDLNKI